MQLLIMIILKFEIRNEIASASPRNDKLNAAIMRKTIFERYQHQLKTIKNYELSVVEDWGHLSLKK